MKKVKESLWGLCLLMVSGVAQAVPATDFGTYFVANGKPQVNETLIRSGKNNNGEIEFMGYATFDLSGIAAEDGISLSGHLKVFSGKPTGLIVDYLGTYGDGALTLASGAEWSTAPAESSRSLSPQRGSITAKMSLPAESLVSR
jgi:hypothetical protein